MAVLPLLKIGTLAVKTFCKPIANSLTKEAGYHPLFREFIINIAQAHNRVTHRVQRQIYGRGIDIVIRPLDEEKAVKTAAHLLGEFFLLTVGGAAAILELSGSRMKEERRIQELQAIRKELVSMMEFHAQKLDHVGKEVEKQVEILDHVGKQVDHVEKQVKILDHVEKQVDHVVKQVEILDHVGMQVDHVIKQVEILDHVGKQVDHVVKKVELLDHMGKQVDHVVKQVDNLGKQVELLAQKQDEFAKQSKNNLQLSF